MQPERADMNKDLGACPGSQATPGAAEEASPPIGFDPARIARLRSLLSKASPLPWSEGWNTRYLGDGFRSMCGRGPDTIALTPDHPRYNELVADQALADAALIAEAVNALPELLRAASRQSELLAELEATSNALERATDLLRRSASAMSAGTAATTEIGAGLQPASAVAKPDAQGPSQ